MEGDRHRIVCNPDYIQAVGLALFAFARLEWTVIWCAEKLEPGCIHTLPRISAGPVSDALIRLAPAARDHALKPQLVESAARFRELVGRRNALMHAKPITAEDGRQVLDRYGTPWTIPMIDALADDFVECEIALNQVFHEYLDKPH